MSNMLKCEKCASYGLEVKCSCGAKRTSPKPARFSPEDRYGSYRRAAKKEMEAK